MTVGTTEPRARAITHRVTRARMEFLERGRQCNVEKPGASRTSCPSRTTRR
jgi:hypothetical protein